MGTGQSEQGSSTGGTPLCSLGRQSGPKEDRGTQKAKQSRSISVRCAAMAANFAKLPELLRGRPHGG